MGQYHLRNFQNGYLTDRQHLENPKEAETPAFDKKQSCHLRNFPCERAQKLEQQRNRRINKKKAVSSEC